MGRQDDLALQGYLVGDCEGPDLEDQALEGLIHLKPTMAHNKQGQRVARQFMEADYAHNTHEKIQKVGGTGIYLGFGTDKCPLANMTGGRSG
jgi:hypothetical protein